MPTPVKKATVLRLQRKYAKRFGLDAKYLPYLAAQIEQESGFRTNLGSRAGAQDVAQFMPGTAPGFGVTLGDNKIEDDIRGQVKMMSGLIRRQGNINDALRGYNAGEGAIAKSHGFGETNHYVSIVRQLAKKYQGQADAETGGPAAVEGTAGTPDRTVTLPGNPDVNVKTGGRMDPAGLMSVLERLGRKDYDALDFAGDYRALEADAAASEQTLNLPGVDPTTVTIPGTPATPGRRGGGGGGSGGGGRFDLKPRGGYRGTNGPISEFSAYGQSLGLDVSSSKRNNTNPYSGDRSDHDFGNTDATARDMADGGSQAPTPKMDTYAKKVADTLGIPYKKGTPINKRAVINGIRYQLIYRGSGPEFGGNHMNHVHLGAKRVGRGGSSRGVLR